MFVTVRACMRTVCAGGFFCACPCIHSVAQVRVSVPDEPAHVEAEGQEAGPQQVTQSSQVGDGEVVGVHASTPHPVDHPVCQVEKDYHLEEDEAEAMFY